jgi:hypothetical protein
MKKQYHYSKYKIMEMQIQKSKQTMLSKIPEIKKAVEIIGILSKKRGFKKAKNKDGEITNSSS